MVRKSFQEADIREGVASGGRLASVFIVGRPDTQGGGWVLYLRTSWARGYRPLRTFRDKADRVFKDLDRLITLVRKDFSYPSEISLFCAGDEALGRFKALLPADRDALGLNGAEHVYGDLLELPSSPLE